MMGPFLIFASLMNKASMALYYDAPLFKTFGHFVQKAQATPIPHYLPHYHTRSCLFQVTMLGLVPSMVKSWRAEYEKSGLVHDWSTLRCFASTGAASAHSCLLMSCR